MSVDSIEHIGVKAAWKKEFPGDGGVLYSCRIKGMTHAV